MEETGVSETLWDRFVRHFGGLYRDRENGLLLGVCAGLAGFYGLNPFGLRVVAILALLMFALPTALVYLVLGFTLRDVPLTYLGAHREKRFWRFNDGKRNDYGAGR